MRLIVVLGTALFPAGSSRAQDRPSGTLRGTFTVEGKLPPPAILARLPDGTVIPDESLETDPKTGGLANVFVFLPRAPGGAIVPSPPRESVTIDMAGRRYSPHVLAVRVGQKFTITNSDPVAQNFHITPIRNRPRNNVLPPKGRAEIAYNKFETVPVVARSDISPWMQAPHFVVDHPWFAISDAQGRFTIENVPAGRHDFAIWHERIGFLERKIPVTIEAMKTTEIADVYPAEKFPEPFRAAADENNPYWVGPFFCFRREIVRTRPWDDGRCAFNCVAALWKSIAPVVSPKNRSANSNSSKPATSSG